MRRLLPSPADHVSVLEAYQADRRAHPDGRPWVGLCMVASIDGSIAVDGTSAGLSNATDSQVLHTLREIADVIVVGAGTVRSEGYGRPKKAGQRVGVVTGSGDVDLSTPLFTSGAGFLICPASAPALDVDTLRAGTDRLDLAAALQRIHEIAPAVTFVQAEGGAALNGALLDADLIDEINLTTSPQMVGSTSPRVTATEHEYQRRYQIEGVFTDDEGYVFTRWVRRPTC
jgi:riboflavin biosynthesis pyrimidine reductase